MTERIFARIAVRESERASQAQHLILGMTSPEVFKPGHVYEIVEFIGEHVIRDLGPSAASGPNPPSGVTWGRDANSLIYEGHTGEQHELDFRCLFGSTYFAESVERD